MAANDLLGTLEAQYALGLGTLDATAASRKGTLLATAITAVSESIAEHYGTVIYGTVTGELHDGGRPYVYLDHQPVQGIVQVVEYDETTAATLTAESNTSKPADGYVVELANGRVGRRNGNADTNFPKGVNNVYVTYVAGRYASTATVGAKWKEAASLYLKSVWRAYEDAVGQVDEFDVPVAQFPRFAIPNAVKELLARERRTGSGTGD